MSDLKFILKSVQSLSKQKSFSDSHKLKIQKNVLIISPHPDDEAIQSSLALRLQSENKCELINVCVTLGSKKNRQQSRSLELKKSCKELNIQNYVLTKDKQVHQLASLIIQYKPVAIICPHSHDSHPTHVKTNQLLQKTLKVLPKNYSTTIFWSEFWGAIAKPNLLIEISPKIVRKMMKALECHKGEIIRNPYHLRLPAWMMDNVRRGSEIVAGTGNTSAQFLFGTIYMAQNYKQNKLTDIKLKKSFISMKDDIGKILN
jgi:LmbE family N-acetylglucosaminyl deacetylase